MYSDTTVTPTIFNTNQEKARVGHFVGTVLMAQGLEDGNTGFFEGDDRATIDGKLKLHGTGSEDYFNGDWYVQALR